MSTSERQHSNHLDRRKITIGGQTINPGRKATIELPIGSLIDYQPITMTVHVRRGIEDGPCLLLTSGIHGDEINGIEIVRRLLKSRQLAGLKGDLIAVPVVNIPSFLGRTRYLPDRRDLNRLFPGSDKGSLGGRIANVFVNELLGFSTHAIDMHTGAVGRPNLPQIRHSPGDSPAFEMAQAFRAPVVIATSLRDGSLRSTYYQNKIPSILYEAGEAHRLDNASLRYGVRGVIATMRHLGMLPAETQPAQQKSKTVFSPGTNWVRAPRGGIFSPSASLGKAVSKDGTIGMVCDPLGKHVTKVKSKYDGIIIGFSCEATVDEGDALFHIARSNDPEHAEEQIEKSEKALEDTEAELFPGES